MDFTGVFSVLPTPFDAGGAIDHASLRRVVDLYVGAGVNGLTALGVTSEIARLTDAERWETFETIVAQVDGRVPIVAGTTAAGTDACIAYTCRAKQMGAAAVMVSPPRMPKLNSEAIVRHFATLAEAVDIPVVVQDFPPITGYAMEPVLLARIAREVPAARTIKLEDAPTPFKVSRIREATADVPVRILGGLGGVFLLEELLAGADGAMTGFAYPEILVDVVKRFRAGDVDGATGVFYRFVPLMRFEFQAAIGIALRKEVLRRRGAITHAGIRLPGAALDDDTREALTRLLQFIRQYEEATWISV